MTVLAALACLNALSIIALAIWAVRKISRLRENMNLAHNDLDEMKFSYWKERFDRDFDAA